MSLIRKDDLVEVVSGPYRGERGKVLKVNPTKDTVIVEGINIRVKHNRVRQTEEGGQAGGIEEIEAPIHVSNVMFVDPKTEKPVRLGKNVSEDGTRTRVTKGKNSSQSEV